MSVNSHRLPNNLSGEMMNKQRRGFCSVLAATPVFAAVSALGLSTGPARAAAGFPQGPVTLVVPFAPGGNTDIIGRMIGKGMSAHLDTNVVVENRAGAGGNIGASTAARARPDGQTMLYSTATTFAINPHIYANLSFDPLKDFIPVAVTIEVPVVVVVPASSGIKTLKELAEHVRKNAKSSSYGSNGNGTSSHIACHVLAQKMGVPELLHVPYKQGPQVLTDLTGGQLTYAFDAWSVLGPQVKAGRLVALAVSGKNRLKAAPDVPTVAEALDTDYEIVTWNAFCVPAGTPEDRVQSLRAAVVQTMADPELAQRLESEGVPPMPPMSAEETAAFFKSEYDKWGKLVKLVGADAVN